MNLRPMRKSHALLFGALGLGVLMMAGGADAQVQGQCSNCHTMHASQNNQAMGSGGPFDVLLRFDCLGCHTGSNGTGAVPGTVSGSNAPGVLDTGDPFTADSFLAGGNFYSVEQGNDAHGHNVKVLPTGHTDALLGDTPPGYDGTTPTVAALPSPHLSCGGATGCHGDLTVSRPDDSEAQSFAAIAGAHHGQTGVVDGSTVGQSFRFLLGMPGGESADYEFAPSSTNHNVYPGKARAADSDEADGGLGALTMSGLCAKCHANFHNSSPTGTSTGIQGEGGWGNPWIRHPTDFDFSGLGGEYAVNMDVYNPLVPVGRDITQVGAANFQDLVGQQDSNIGETGGNIVICLSCHRAHGSQYDDILRWDYVDMVAGAPTGGMADNGCFYCHATKDGA
ncbi:MAG: cytochrome c3 family protein [Desulfobulbaceae bacterium]|nr:cytochrome c3 family protein [Desulfobulbaceae bacterium]